MQGYESIVEKVLEYYSACGYSKIVIDNSSKCFTSLKLYLEQTGQEYSDRAAALWMVKISKEISSTQKLNFYKCALVRLSEAYATGQVQTQRAKGNNYSRKLLFSWRYELDNYVRGLSAELSYRTRDSYRYGCAHFLLFCQRHGIVGVDKISYSIIIEYHKTEVSEISTSKAKANEVVASFMRYLYSDHRVPYGFTIINHCLGMGKNDFWNQVSNETLQKAHTTQGSQEQLIALNDFLRYRDDIIKLLVENQYSYGVYTGFKQITDLLYLFLEMNGLQYCVSISWLWYDCMRPFWASGRYLGIRRYISILEQYFTTGEINFGRAFRNSLTNYDRLPDWCKSPINTFLSMRKAEGRKPNSIVNYRVQISKFCLFIVARGLTSFSQLDIETLKQFNLSDKHKSSKGKNAYNGTIRMFIQYLSEEGIITNTNLYLALLKTSAPSERIVEILSSDEIDLLDSELDNSSDTLLLRDKAILKLGLEMGIRPVDIANLRISDIDWDKFTIRFIQEKTNVEVCFIMPPGVAKAVYSYMMNERPETECENIFVATRAPYDKLLPSFCLRTMKKILPNRDFYITRKTYATSLLRNNVSVDNVISALGQRSRHSINHYLMLDDERMRLCPICLTESNIKMKGVLIK